MTLKKRKQLFVQPGLLYLFYKKTVQLTEPPKLDVHTTLMAQIMFYYGTNTCVPLCVKQKQFTTKPFSKRKKRKKKETVVI